MKKIAFLIRSLNYGGAERQLVILAKAMVRGRAEVVVLHFYGGPLAKELQESGVALVSLNKKGRWDIVGFFVRLVRALHQWRPEVLNAYMAGPNILAIFLKPFLPETRMIWGIRASNMDLKHYDWLARLSDRIESVLSRFPDGIIVNSRAGFHHAAAKGFSKNKMAVIPNGIDTGRFKPDPESGKKMRAIWKISDEEILIGHVGRLDPMKDHPTFLKAAALIASERENVRFVCVGEGPESYKGKLLALTEELGLSGRLLWAGSQNDMPPVYNALDLFCSSSYGEGFPNVIGEAMACGIPCVVTDVGDSAWIVGETGIVVPPKVPEALVNAWFQCLAGDKTRTAVQARSRIKNNFSVQQLVQRTEEIIFPDRTFV